MPAHRNAEQGALSSVEAVSAPDEDKQQPMTIRAMRDNVNIFIIENGQLRQWMNGEAMPKGLIDVSVRRPVCINSVNLYGHCLVPHEILSQINATLSAAELEQENRMKERSESFYVPLTGVDQNG